MHILITGANRGIGAALTTAARGAGHEVTGTARHGDDEGFLPLDVTDPDSLNTLSDRLGNRPIDCLVCNAGVFLDKGQSLADGYTPDLWDKSFAVNVTGVFLTVQTCLPNLRKGNAPRIAIISSQMGSSARAPGGSYIYRASKSAATNLGRNLATDLKPEGIAVGIYHPGWVQTDMGGAQAEITPEQSAHGLLERITTLGIEHTGAFETWDGRPHAY